MRFKLPTQGNQIRTVIWALLITLVPFGVATAPSANAITSITLAESDALVFNRANGFTNFVGDGKSVNSQVLYKSVGNFGGIAIDCLITTLAITTGSISNYDAEGSATTSPAATYKNNFMLNTVGGEVRMRFDFFKAGTYTGTNTGISVMLQNVKITSIDLDSSGTGAYQYSDFTGFQKYSMMSPTNLAVQPITGSGASDPNRTRFIAAKTGARSSAPEDQVLVKYDAMTSLEIRFGNLVSGSTNYFGLVFGGWPGTGTPVEYPNSFNAPPVSTDTTIYVTDTTTAAAYTNIPTSAFGTYSDSDGNPFYSVKISSVSSGKLQLNNGSGTWSDVTANQVILKSDIDAGYLRYAPSSMGASETVKFYVNDGLDYSVAINTLTLTKTTNSQTITFANPGNKPASQTFVSNASASSGLTVTLTSNTLGVCTVSAGNIITVANGTCSITATQAGDANYGSAAPVTQEFLVTSKTPQVITFANPGTKTETTTSFASGATTNATGLYVTLTPADTAICTVTNSASAQPRIAPIKAGFCTVIATQAGDTTYDPAVQVSVTFEITGTSTSSSSSSSSTPLIYTTGVETNTVNSSGDKEVVMTGLITPHGITMYYKFCWSSSSTNSNGVLNGTNSGINIVKCSTSALLGSTGTLNKVFTTETRYLKSDGSDSNFSSGKTYYYQVIGYSGSSSGSPIYYGKIMPFTVRNTSSKSSTVNLIVRTEPVTNIQETSVSLKGITYSSELTTAVKFCVSTALEYLQTSVPYTNLKSCDVLPTSSPISSQIGIVKSETATVYSLTGLTGNTTYYFQVSGSTTSSKLTKYGNIVPFTTSSAPPVVTTLPVTTFESTTAVLPGSVLANGDTTTVTFQYCTDLAMTASCVTGNATPGTVSGYSGKSVSYATTGLTIGTTYYYRAIGNRGSAVNGAVKSFVVGAPTVVTLAATSIGSGWVATLNGYVKPNGVTANSKFCYSTSSAVSDLGALNSSPTCVSASVDSTTASMAISQTLSGLSANTTYYFQAVAENGSNTAIKSYGSVFSFTTALPPTTTTVDATNVNDTTATLNGTGTSNGDSTTVTFCLSDTSTVLADNADALGSCNVMPLAVEGTLAANASGASVSAAVSDLAKRTTYWFQTIASNSLGTALGAIKNFTTTAGGPYVQTLPITSPTSTSATLNGNVASNGSNTTAYFCWGTSSSVTSLSSGDSMTACTTAPAGGFTISSATTATEAKTQALSGLTNTTTYYYQIYAVNARGEYGYGAVLSFALNNPIAVTSATVDSITATSATINGSINLNGNSGVAGRFCIGLVSTLSSDGLISECPQQESSATEVAIPNGSSGAVSISGALTGLDSGQVYYYQTYSASDSGSNPKSATALGEVKSFRTHAIVNFNPGTGGTGSVDSQTAGSSTALKLISAMSFTNGSNTFNGWNSAEDGTGTNYVDGATYAFLENVDLYAQWTSPVTTYAITYSLGGGSGTTPTESAKAAGATFTAASSSGITRSGYTFAGWDCNSTTFAAGGIVTVGSAAMTCTALWTAVSSGGSGGGGGGGVANTPTPTPTPSASPSATATPRPTALPTLKPTPAPTVKPVVKGTLTTKVTAKKIVPNAIVTLSQVVKISVPSTLEVQSISVNGVTTKVTSQETPKPTASSSPAPAQPGSTTGTPTAVANSQVSATVSTTVVGPNDNVQVNATTATGQKIQGVVEIEKVDPFTLANVNFDFASAKLTPAAKRILDKVAAVVIEHGFNQIQLAGHTDVFTSAGYDNQKLSEQRAAAVKAYLSKKLAGEGIAVKTLGLAAKIPVVAKVDDASRALNRRVEILVATK